MYALDDQKFQATLTGVVNPVPVFGDNGRPTGEHASDESGVPLWGVEIMRTVKQFGREQGEISTVQVPSAMEPKAQALTPARFRGLVLNVYVKRGERPSLGQTITADALVTGGEQK